jgi:hypothetical protein
MQFFQWLLANKDALLAIIVQLEKIFGSGVPSLARDPLARVPRLTALDLREGVEAAATAQGLDLAAVQAFIAAVEKWLPVLEAIFAEFETSSSQSGG